MRDTKFHTDEFYTLKEKVEGLDRLTTEKHNALKEYLESKLSGIAEATNKALDANNKRLEGMNEFRATLKDQTSTFISRTDFDAQHERVREDIKRLELSKAELAGKASVESVISSNKRAVVGQYIAIVGVILSAIAIMITIIYKV